MVYNYTCYNMKTNIIKIGNSRGVIIPKQLLKEAGVKSQVEMEVRGGGLFIKPIDKPREGWEEAAIQAHKEKSDQLLIPDIFEDENIDDWTW
jgi:antitoxin MazE